MWAMTPATMLILALLSWMVLCWVRIWAWGFPVEILRRVFLSIYAVLGLHLLDVVGRLCFSGLIGFGSFRSVALPVILCAGLGVLYLIWSTFVTPTWPGLLTFLGVGVAYGLMTLNDSSLGLNLPLGVGAGLTLLFNGIDAIRCRRRGGERSSPPMWDWTVPFNRWMKPKTYVFVLLLLCAELVFMVEGRSLLFW